MGKVGTLVLSEENLEMKGMDKYKEGNKHQVNVLISFHDLKLVNITV